MKKGKVVSFGEILLRICPDLNDDWVGNGQLPFFIGGAELNVATALALWGIDSEYVSAMPNNIITEGILADLKQKNIGTEAVALLGSRLGIYYLPKGKDLKNSSVIYDRKDSSFANLKEGDINWDAIFEGVSFFHFSAICPAINQELANVCLEAVKAASVKGIFISLDLNYRSKLWKYDKSPIEVMCKLASYCNLIMGNIWAANLMLGTNLDDFFNLPQAEYPKEKLLNQAKETSDEIIKRFPNCQYVANTFRFDYKEIGVKYYTSWFEDGVLTISNEYKSEQIVDKVGSGDCFMAGLIYGVYHKKDPKEILDFATAAAFDKLFITSDATTSNVKQILKRIRNE